MTIKCKKINIFQIQYICICLAKESCIYTYMMKHLKPKMRYLPETYVNMGLLIIRIIPKNNTQIELLQHDIKINICIKIYFT